MQVSVFVYCDGHCLKDFGSVSIQDVKPFVELVKSSGVVTDGGDLSYNFSMVQYELDKNTVNIIVE